MKDSNTESKDAEDTFPSSPHPVYDSFFEQFKARMFGDLVRGIFCGAALSKIQQPANRNPFSSRVILENVRIETRSGDTLGAWTLYPAAARPKKWALVLHGNCTNRYTFSQLYDLETLVETGVCALVVDYRGFGDSEGRPSRSAFVEDVAACMSYLKGKNARRISILGYSLGSAIALDYLANYYNRVKHRMTLKVGRIVLVSPFISTVALLREYKAWNLIEAVIPEISTYVRDGFGYDSLKSIKKVRMPILVVHGEEDWVVPWTHGEALSIASSSLFVKIDKKSHITVFRDPDVWKRVNSFLTM